MGNHLSMAETVDTRRVAEFSESPHELNAKLDLLVKMAREANGSIVFFTGAGISTAAGIADYRGPTGVWTRQRIKKLQSKASRTPAEHEELALLLSEAKKKGADGAAKGGFGKTSAAPTLGHMALSTLVRHGLAQHVVTTNLDGLHRKSGLEHHKSLTCLHGDIYIERCTGCGHEHERDYHVRNKAPRKLNVHDHSIGTCTKCGSKPPASYTGKKGHGGCRKGLVKPSDKNCGTKDTHINFGESLDEIDWDEAERVCGDAKLCIVVGTSMSLRHVTHMPFMAQRTVIVNLQKTPDDDKAHLRIFADADQVLNSMMERLNLPIDPVPPTARRPQLPLAPKKAPPSATSMRKHIQVTRGASINAETVELTVEAAPVGVSVRGREVIKVTSGSQAERLGVQVGWKITHVDGKDMPASGQVAADGITKALAAGKKEKRPYSITFIVPAKGKRGGVGLPSVSTKKPMSKPAQSNVAAKTAFSAFSSGLGSEKMSEAMLIKAHQSMTTTMQGMAQLEAACAC